MLQEQWDDSATKREEFLGFCPLERMDAATIADTIPNMVVHTLNSVGDVKNTTGIVKFIIKLFLDSSKSKYTLVV